MRDPLIEAIVRDVRQQPWLTADETMVLGRRARRGDAAAIDRLVRGHLWLALRVADDWSGGGVEVPDLFQEAALALGRAARRWDPARGVAFADYARRAMANGVRRAIGHHARQVRVPRGMLALGRRLERLAGEMRQRLGEEPCIDDLARVLDVDLDDAVRARESLHVSSQLSLDVNATARGRGGEYNHHHQSGSGDRGLSEPVSPDPSPEERVTLRHDIEHQRRAYAQLSHEHRVVLRRLYGHGETPTVIAKRFKLTARAVTARRDEALAAWRELRGDRELAHV